MDDDDTKKREIIHDVVEDFSEEGLILPSDYDTLISATYRITDDGTEVLAGDCLSSIWIDEVIEATEDGTLKVVFHEIQGQRYGIICTEEELLSIRHGFVPQKYKGEETAEKFQDILTFTQPVDVKVLSECGFPESILTNALYGFNRESIRDLDYRGK